MSQAEERSAARTADNSLAGVLGIEAVGGPGDACLGDLREVLARHGLLGRVGVALLAPCFELAEGEALVEATDPVRRERVLRVVDASALGAAGIDMQTSAVGFEAGGRGHYCGCRSGLGAAKATPGARSGACVEAAELGLERDGPERSGA